MKIKILILSLFFFGCHQNEKQPPFEFIFSKKIIADFQSPESVIYDAEREAIYVSNGIGFAKNGLGFISKLSKEGEVLDLKWAENLNRPTGMAILKNQLFAADIDELRVFDLESGKSVKQYSVSEEHPMLNDVAISETGEIYVTSSGKHGVYHLEKDTLKMLFQNDSLLKYANGIVIQKDKIIVVGWDITEISLTDNSIKKRTLNPPLNDFDGLVIDENGNLFCTQVSEEGKLWKINPDGAAELVFEYPNYLADFDFTKIAEKRFLIASGNHEKKTYSVLSISQ